ncbi:uncharacterized protein LOC121384996 isoform X2 [Gigantopelta aegis]|nr:uncharacterized protein LOC121384996 isoform X2 [Gigantopelta aegis]
MKSNKSDVIDTLQRERDLTDRLDRFRRRARCHCGKDVQFCEFGCDPTDCCIVDSLNEAKCFPGDVRLLLDNGNYMEMRDLRSGHRILTGLYVPVTDAGTLVVDGMFVSCYSFIQHDLAHLSTVLYRSFPWILEPWQQDGFSPFLSSLQYLGTVILPKSVLRLG